MPRRLAKIKPRPLIFRPPAAMLSDMWDQIAFLPPKEFLAFVAGGLIVNIAPGQDVLFASASGIQGGPRVGAFAGLGVGAGALWHVALAALGLSALVASLPAALDVIRYVGAAYLLYIAWKTWTTGALTPGRGAPTAKRAFVRGALTNALNPKPILFFLAFLPQFVHPQLGPIWSQVAILGLTFGATGTLVTMAYGIAAGLVGKALGERMAILNKIAALMFAGLAARLVLTE